MMMVLRMTGGDAGRAVPGVRTQSSHQPQSPGPRACPRCRPPRCRRPRPPPMTSRPSELPSRRGAARPNSVDQFAPNEPDIVFRSAFRRAARRGHRMRCVSLGSGGEEGEGNDLESQRRCWCRRQRWDDVVFGTGSGRSLGSGSGGRAGACGVSNGPA
ncbi:hypothetical protein EDB89DRAFT_173254 [Lactarius sanguifluus]|nr:hypothetical protein EDB89DRAFT_173254 [Lactarius sanguifluus]